MNLFNIEPNNTQNCYKAFEVRTLLHLVFFLSVLLAVQTSLHAQEAEASVESEKPDIFWMKAGGGYSYIALAQLSENNFIPTQEGVISHGGMFEGSLGFRLWILTIGAKSTIASYSEYDMGTITLDLALEAPWTFSPYLRAAFGYGWMGNADFDDPRLSQTQIDGIVGEVGAGFGFRITDWIGIGAGVDAAFFNLKRQRLRDGCGGGNCELFDVELDREGSAAALQIRAAAHLSLLI